MYKYNMFLDRSLLILELYSNQPIRFEGQVRDHIFFNMSIQEDVCLGKIMMTP